MRLHGKTLKKIYVSTRIRTRVFFTDTRGEFLHGDLHLSYTFYEIEKCNMHFASWYIHTPISLNGALMKSVLHAFYLHAQIHFISVLKCVFHSFLMHVRDALDLCFEINKFALAVLTYCNIFRNIDEKGIFCLVY